MHGMGIRHEQQGGYGLLDLRDGNRSAADAIGIALYGRNVLKLDFACKSTQQQSGACYSRTPAHDAQRTFGGAPDLRY